MKNILFFFLILSGYCSFSQTTYYSLTNGNWNNPATWSTSTCGSGSSGSFPQVNDVAVICHTVTLNQSITCSDILVNPGGILNFGNGGSHTLTITQHLTIVSGGILQYTGNSSLAHTINLTGNLSNNGNLDLYFDVNDFVNLNFIGGINTVVSGSGLFDLFNISVNKNTKLIILEVATSSFYSNFNSGTWTHTQGTYYHNNNATHTLGNGVDYTINENSIVRIENNGTINFAQNASKLILRGRLELMFGTVYVGSTATGGNNGIKYEQAGGIVPELIIHNGTMNIYQGINYNTVSSPLAFTQYGGILNLNMGSVPSNAVTMLINDVANSMFYMSGGTINFYKPTSLASTPSDIRLCATNGTVTSLGGTLVFGQSTTANNSVFRFTPHANVTYPSVRISGASADSIIVKPSVVGDFRFRSLYIESKKTFDMSHNGNQADSRTMTLTATYNGTIAFQDDNFSYTDYFLYRNSTVVIEGSSGIKVNDDQTYKTRFYNLRCAYPGFTTTLMQTTGVLNITYLMGGTLQSSAGWEQLYMEGNNPLLITAGTTFAIDALKFNKWGGAQNIPSYNYNTKIYICGHNNSTYLQGDVQCTYLYVNGDTKTDRACTFYTSNNMLIVDNQLEVGTSGGNSTLKKFYSGTSNVTLNGNLVIWQDAEYYAESSALYIFGNWTNQALVATNRGFNQSNSTVIFSGGNTSLSCTNGPEDFYQIRVDKSSGDLTLNAPITISFKTTFAAGKIIAGPTNHVTFKYGASHTGAGTNSHIAGPLRYVGMGTLVFPIGKGGRYRPCTLYSTNSGFSTDIHRAEYFDTSPDPPYTVSSKDGVIGAVSTCEYWMLQNENGSSTGRLRLNYGSGSCSTASFATFGVCRWDGAVWRDLGGTGGSGRTGNASAGSIESSVTTDYNAPYTIATEVGPSITAAGPTTFCTGNSVMLTSSSGPSYSWSTGETTQSIIVSSSGSYTVTVSGMTSAPMVVSAVSPPAPPTATNIKVCTGTSGVLTATGAGNYIWYDASVGGVVLGAGATYTTPNLSVSTTYYVSSTNGSCESSTRTAVTAAVVTKPTLTTNVSNTYVCGTTYLNALTSGVSNAIRLDGADDHIAMPSGIYFNGNYTVEGWVNLKAHGNNQPMIDFGSVSNMVQIELSNSGTNKLRFVTYKGSTARSLIVPASVSQLNLNEWVHVACRIKDSTGTIFINGDSVVSGLLYPGQNTVSNPAYIGRSVSGGFYTNADIDEFRIWNTARTSSQIKGGMITSYPTGTANIISYLRMDEGTGTITDDDVIATNPVLWGSPAWIFNGAPIDITYAWSPPAGLSSTTDKIVKANPTVSTTYTVTVNYLSGCSNSANIVVNPSIPGDTSVYGTTSWNVYAFNSKNYTNYFGYYTDAVVNLNSFSRWTQTSSPSSASGYQGCTVPSDSFSIKAKRTNFSPNTYQINIVQNDDEMELWIDQQLIFSRGSSTSNQIVWVGNLNALSQVEIRLKEYFGNSYIDVNFSPTSATSLNPGSISGTQSYCSSTDPSAFTSVLAATGCSIRSYQWQDSIVGGNWTNITNATGLTYDPGILTQTHYYRRQVTDHCNAVAYTNVISVSILTTVLPTITGTTNICVNTSTILTASGGGPSYEWYTVSSGGTSFNSASSYTTPNISSATTYYVSSKNGSCESGRTSVTITAVAAPTTSAAGTDQNVCAATATLAANTPVDGTGSWSVVSGTATVTTPSSPTSGVTGLVVGSATLRWTISNAPCAASTDDVIITRVATPTTSAAGTDQSVCAATATLAANTPVDGTGSWSVVSGTATITTPSSPTSGVTGLVVGSATLRWTISNAPCAASTDDVIITRLATPTTSAAGTDQNVCAATATLAANTPVNGTGSWSVVSGAATVTTPSSPTSGVTGLVVGSATLRWTISNAPCAASTDDVIITRVATPTTSAAGTDQNVCAATATLAANTPVSGTGGWSVVSGTATVTTPSSPTSGVTGLVVGSATLRWTISNAPCAASTDDVIITRVATPTTSAAGTDQNVCAATATLAANTPVDGTGSWSVVSGTATVTTPSSPTSGVTGLVVGSATLRWTISNAPCAASTDDVIITRVATPTTSAAGTDQNVCAATATLAANTPVDGTGSWSVVSGTATVTTPSSPTSGVTGLVVGSATLRWTISNAPCAASTDDVIITRVATPTTSAAGTDQNVCAATATLTANTPVDGTGSWSVVSGTATVTTPSSPTSGVTGLVVGSATLRWTISNAPCAASTDDVIITRAGTPTVSIPAQCGGQMLKVETSGNSYALDFDGVSDYAQIPSISIPASDFTIEAWVKLRSYNTDAALCDFGNGPSTNNITVKLSQGTTGLMEFGIYNGGTNTTTVIPFEPIPLNEWTHIACVLVGTNTGLIYVNGRIAGIGVMQLPAAGVRTTNFIGKTSSGGPDNSNMLVDQFRFWTVSRSQVQINSNMTVELPPATPNLLLNITANEGTGISTTDIANSTAINLSGVSWSSLSSPTGSTYSWTPSATLSSGTSWNPYPASLVSQTYKVVVTNASGCKDSASYAVTAVPGNPTVFGNNTWNFYTYDGENFQIYHGYFSRSSMNFLTDTIYDPAVAPHVATGYNGCNVGTRYSFAAKRTNFTPGNYTLSILDHDDLVEVLVDGISVFAHTNGCCDSHPAAWSGCLNASSTMEIRLRNSYLNGRLKIDLQANVMNGGTISADQTICKYAAPVALNSTALPSLNCGAITYVWEDSISGGNWISLPSSNGANYTPGILTTDTWFRRKATDSYGLFAYSNAIKITVTDPGTPVAPDASNCAGYSTSITAAGSNGDYNWYDDPLAGILVFSGNPYNFTLAGTDSVFVTATFAGCESPRVKVNIISSGTKPAITFQKPYYCSTDRVIASTNGQSGSLTFDGVDDNVQLPSATYFNGDFTVEGWIYLDQFSNWQRFFDFGNGQRDNNVLITFDGQYDQRIEVHVYNGSNKTSLPSTTGLNPYLNNWLHVAYSQQGTTGYLYLNGELSNSGTMYVPTNVVRTSNFFGKSNWFPDAITKGKMDEIRIWNLYRTQAEIQSTMYSEIAPNTAGLQNYWKCNEPSGTVLTDLTSGNDGTLMNGIARNTTGAPLGYTFAWTPATNLSSTADFYTRANPAAATTYQVVVNNSGCKDSATILVNPAPLIDVNTYGTTAWNVYVHDGFNFDALHGSFQQAALNYDSRNSYTQANSPSTAIGYVGCDVPNTYHSQYVRRTNFTTGIYRLDIGGHDDNLKIILDGDTVFTHNGCCDAHNGAWLGRLTPATLFDLQIKNRIGPSFLFFSLNPDLPIPLNPGSISNDQLLCGYQIPDTLRNVMLATGCSMIKYQWQDSSSTSGSWNDIALATDTFYVSPGRSETTWFRRKATDACAQDAYSNEIKITIDIPAAPTAVSRAICSPGTVTLVATGGTNYKWYDSPGGGLLLSSDDTLITPIINTTTTYHVSAVSVNGCEGPRTAVDAQVISGAPGNTTTYGTNAWIVYAFNGNNYDTYRGFYDTSSIDLSTTINYPKTLSPSYANSYQGCVVDVDNHSSIFKRQGFPNGFYKIDFNTFDDNVQLYINNQLVFIDSNSLAPHYHVWQGELRDTTKVEIRLAENTGTTQLRVSFVPVTNPDLPILVDPSKDTTFCVSGDVPVLTSGNTILPSKDSYVMLGSPTTNYGFDPSIYVKLNDPPGHTRIGLMTFTIPNAAPVQSAILEVYAHTTNAMDSSYVMGVYSVNDTTWGEGTLNFNNLPAIGSLLDTARIFRRNNFYQFDITDYINAEIAAGRSYSTVAFKAMKVSFNVILTDSREGTFPPKLILNKSLSPCTNRIQWQENIGCNTSWIDLPGATKDNFDPGVVTQKTCYRKYISDNCGRSDTSAVVTISVDAPSVAGTVTGNNTVCGNAGSEALTLNGYTATQFFWQTSYEGLVYNVIPLSNADTYTATNIPDTTWYRAIATNGVCPRDTSAAFQLNAIFSKAGTVGKDTTVCANSNATVSLQVISGGVITWESSADNFQTINPIVSSNDTLINPVSQTLKFRAIVQNGTCPTDTSDEIQVNANPAPSLVISDPTPVCSPLTIDITTASVVAGSQAGLTFTYWQDIAATISEANANNLSSSNTWYIKGSDALGCFSVSPVAVQVNPVPALTINDPSPVCAPYTADITAASVTAGSDAGLTYTYWTDAGLTTTESNASALSSAGTYYIKGSSAAGCFTSAPVSVTINAPPAYTLNAPIKVLKGNNTGTILISGITDPIVQWETSLDNFSSIDQVLSVTNASIPVSNVADSTWYRVVLNVPACGNYPTSSTAVWVFNPMQFYVPDTIEVFKNSIYKSTSSLVAKISFKDPYATNALADTATTIASGVFQLDNTGQFSYRPPADYLGLDSASYTICTNDLNAPYCEVQKVYFKMVEPPPTPGPIIIFSSFSPNGDGTNDSWIIENIEFFPNNTVRILDRWGAIVFEEKGYNNTSKVWNGLGKKGTLPEDTYYYVLEVNNKIEKTGFVVIKR